MTKNIYIYLYTPSFTTAFIYKCYFFKWNALACMKLSHLQYIPNQIQCTVNGGNYLTSFAEIHRECVGWPQTANIML